MDLHRLLACDLGFVAEHVQARKEAQLLLDLGTTAHRCDTLLAEHSRSAARVRAIRESWARILGDGSRCRRHRSLCPLLLQALANELTNLHRTQAGIEGCRAQLASFRRGLETFIDQNESTGRTYESFGVHEMARSKALVAAVESLLHRRLEVLCRADDDTWLAAGTDAGASRWRSLPEICATAAATATPALGRELHLG